MSTTQVRGILATALDALRQAESKREAAGDTTPMAPVTNSDCEAVDDMMLS